MKEFLQKVEFPHFESNFGHSLNNEKKKKRKYWKHIREEVNEL